MNSYQHAQSSARKWGGTPEEYLPVHEFIDGTKQAFGDVRHRALLHNTYGIWLVQEVFGRVLDVEKSRSGCRSHMVKVPVREVAEQHIIEDLGFIPTPGDWLENMNIKGWMGGKQQKFVGREALLTATAKEAT